MNDIIQFIRNLFPTSNRKRPATDIIEGRQPKQRRIVKDTFLEEDWLSIKRLKSEFAMNRREPLNNKPIIIDDDEETCDIDFKSPRYIGTISRKHISSTPNGVHTIDLTLPSKAPSKLDKYLQNREKSFDTSMYTTAKSSYNSHRTSLSNGTDAAFRLDEKRKYEQFINNSTTKSATEDSFLNYYTPMNRMQMNRGRKMVELSQKKRLITVDLTNGFDTTKIPKSRTSLASSNKVHDLTSNEVSEVEILPEPKAPEPDVKVQRVNSLKKKFESCENFKTDWDDRFRKHTETMKKYAEEIKARNQFLSKVQQINRDIVKEQLDEQVKRCLHIKEVVIPLETKVSFPILTEKQEEMIAMALNRRYDHDQVLAKKFNLNITRRDMLTLLGLNWLNDEVINFYMNLIIERGQVAANRLPNVYAFNTFFYPRMSSGGQQSVRRWTRKVDIFAHDLLCVPIHSAMHWCMAIVDMRAKVIQYYDSMGKPNEQCTKTLLTYLQDEHLDKKQKVFDAKGWTMKCPSDIPQQMNGSDCGMFACTFAEFQARSAQFTFQQKDMPYLRRKMVLEIMRGELMMK